MSYACAPILMGVVSPVSEILLLSKTAKFPFPTMDYSPWSSKILSIGIGPKNLCKYGLMSYAFAPILVRVTSPVSEILLLSKMANFPFRPWTIVHGHQKN